MRTSGMKQWILNKLTFLKWVPKYNSDTLKGDLTAGLTVGVMLIPQAMAYAVLAGVPPIYGLYASVIPLLIYPLVGTSRHLAFGVVAIDMLIVSAGVGLIADPGSSSYVMLVIVLTVMVGLIQIAMSVARLGFIVTLLSKPVIIGFTAAAPIIISMSQLDNLLGLQVAHSRHIYALAAEYWNSINSIPLIPAVIGIASIILLLILKKYFKAAPKALIVVVVSAIIVWAIELPTTSLDLVGSIPEGLPHIVAPDFTFEELRRLLPTAITLALVQFMNVISLGRTFGFKHQYSVRPNRELFGIGAANFIGGFFQAIPTSGSFSRSAINEQAGAQTPFANIFSALVVIIALLFLTPLLYFIPMPALAAIIIVAALGLIDLDEVKYLFKTKERDGYVAIFTFFTTLFIGIQEGILLGVAASLLGVLLRASRPNIAVLGHVNNSRIYRDVSRFPEAKQVEGILTIRFDASFSFNNADYLKEYVIDKSEESDRKISHVVIDGMSINDLDTTALEALHMVVQSLSDLDIELHFAGLKGPIRDVMLRSGLARKMGGSHFHLTPHEAVTYILKHAKKHDPDDQRLEEYQKRVE
ncbi:MAG: sulfate permease [Balneolaceae bacterium]|nr:sulfate permease [Balneolaceae bacterium]